MIPFFPQKLSYRAIGIYFIALICISLFFSRYAMAFDYILIGATGVILFFTLSPLYSKKWRYLGEHTFEKNLFILALSLRWAWVFFAYFFYKEKTGQPFEFSAADEINYYEGSLTMAKWSLKEIAYYLNGALIMGGLSDTGYPVVLSLLCKFTGKTIIIPRLIKSLIGAYTCVLLFRLCKRNFGESAGRMAGIFYALMPNAIIYCGNHLKENFMVFLMVAFVERVDYLFRSRRYSVWNIVLPTVIALSLFTFRTVIGVICLFAFATSAIFIPDRLINKSRKRLLIFVWILLGIGTLYGGRLFSDAMEYWEMREDNSTQKREMQVKRGAEWAKYATGTVMVPMIVALPFSTMVDVAEQYNQNVRHGGNFVKNYMSFFVILALLSIILFKRKWREHCLLLSFTLMYLGIIAVSGYANTERFNFPALPFLLAFAAYGVTVLDAKSYKYYNLWGIIVFIMEFGWAFFKIGGRGLL